jgi:ribosomal protein S18
MKCRFWGRTEKHTNFSMDNKKTENIEYFRFFYFNQFISTLRKVTPDTLVMASAHHQ